MGLAGAIWWWSAWPWWQWGGRGTWEAISAPVDRDEPVLDCYIPVPTRGRGKQQCKRRESFPISLPQKSLRCENGGTKPDRRGLLHSQKSSWSDDKLIWTCKWKNVGLIEWNRKENARALDVMWSCCHLNEKRKFIWYSITKSNWVLKAIMWEMLKSNLLMIFPSDSIHTMNAECFHHPLYAYLSSLVGPGTRSLSRNSYRMNEWMNE